MTFQKKRRQGWSVFVTAFLLPFCPLDLENRMTVCMGYPAMTPQWESRKTPPEGGRKLAPSAPAPGYKEVEVQVKEVCVCEAMKSPVGTLSNGTVLRQQDGGTKSRQVPIWQKSNLTLEEAAAYSGIGINKLRSMTDSDECKFVLWNGTKRLIKRRKLDEYLDKAFSI